jgi:chromosome segregation ATPase
MTLNFFNKNKPDTRLVEYDQSIVRLGLEKAEKDKELEQKKKEVEQINISLGLVRNVFLRNWEKLTDEEKKEIGDKEKVLFDYEKQIKNEENKLKELKLEQIRLGFLLINQDENLDERSIIIEKLLKKQKDIEETIEKYIKDKEIKTKERDFTIGLCRDANKKRQELFLELASMGKTKTEVEDQVKKANQELKELNEIILILQTTNKDGLDVVASFDGERKRLIEKEAFLKRKEEDLILYEKRIEKRAIESGIKLNMNFK